MNQETYTCTKVYPEICVAHRNWKSSSHCSFIHGYARTVEVTLSGPLNSQDWVVDLGDLRFIKDFLYEQWEHRLLVSDDDPLLEEMKKLEALGALSLNVMNSSKGHGPTLEQSCKFVADFIQDKLCVLHPNLKLKKIEIWEKSNNRAALHFD